MRYFITETERKASHSTCYFEFQKGSYCGRYWLEDSLCISDELWEECRLYELFRKVLPSFDVYGCNAVSRREWDALSKLAEGEDRRWREIIEELTPWVHACFHTAQEDVFTVCGI